MMTDPSFVDGELVLDLPEGCTCGRATVTTTVRDGRTTRTEHHEELRPESGCPHHGERGDAVCSGGQHVTPHRGCILR